MPPPASKCTADRSSAWMVARALRVLARDGRRAAVAFRRLPIETGTGAVALGVMQRSARIETRSGERLAGSRRSSLHAARAKATAGGGRRIGAERADAEQRARLTIRVVAVGAGEAKGDRVRRTGWGEAPGVLLHSDARQPYPVAVDDGRRTVPTATGRLSTGVGARVSQRGGWQHRRRHRRQQSDYQLAHLRSPGIRVCPILSLDDHGRAPAGCRSPAGGPMIAGPSSQTFSRLIGPSRSSQT